MFCIVYNILEHGLLLLRWANDQISVMGSLIFGALVGSPLRDIVCLHLFSTVLNKEAYVFVICII